MGEDLSTSVEASTKGNSANGAWTHMLYAAAGMRSSFVSEAYMFFLLAQDKFFFI